MQDSERQRGQSVVEFAMCLPLLVLILLGVFDLGRAFNSYIVITNASREGAYYGTMHPTDTNGIKTRAISEAQQSGVTVTAAQVTVSSTGVTGTPMQVTVQHDFSLMTAFLVGRPVIHLTSRTEMMVVAN